MTRDEALRRLESIFGKKMCYRVSKAISSPEKRQQAQAAAAALKARYDEAKAKCEARQNELLSDPLYQELKAERTSLYKAFGLARGEQGFFKFAIGTSEGGIFFHVAAEGDTWEECFRSLEQKKAKAS